MKKLKHLLDNNIAWADTVNKNNPEFFSTLAQQQFPEYLWIGCSDSRVPASQVIALPPGEVFVHRNIANVVTHTDLNCLSVIQFAVDVLKIKHIIVCGHYGCIGVRAAMGDQEYGLVDNWLLHVKDVARFNAKKLDGLSADDKHDRLCELNVQEQVINVCNTNIVAHAWEAGADLTIHGWIYNINNGILKDLDMCISSTEELKEKFAWIN